MDVQRSIWERRERREIREIREIRERREIREIRERRERREIREIRERREIREIREIRERRERSRIWISDWFWLFRWMMMMNPRILDIKKYNNEHGTINGYTTEELFCCKDNNYLQDKEGVLCIHWFWWNLKYLIND